MLDNMRQSDFYLYDRVPALEFLRKSLFQVMKFGMGAQSQEVRENLSKFQKFLEHFSQAKWLGDLVAPEFLQQKKLAVKMLAALQTKVKVALPYEGQSVQNCNHCLKRRSCANGGFCISCGRCCHGRTEPCPSGCSITRVPPKDASSLYKDLGGAMSRDSRSVDKLENLEKMCDALASLVRHDCAVRKMAEKERWSAVWFNIP